MIENNKRHSKIPGHAEIHNLTGGWGKHSFSHPHYQTLTKWEHISNETNFQMPRDCPDNEFIKHIKAFWGEGLYSRDRPVNSQRSSQ